MSPVVFQYSDPRQFLCDVLEQKRRHNPLFSMRAWAKQMGFRCHTSLVFIMTGKRKIRPEHLEYLSRGLKLSGDEEQYWRSLVHLHAAKTSDQRLHHEAQLKLLRPNGEDISLDIERFKLVADWVHMALLEMTRLKNFSPCTDWIARRLKFKVSRKHINESLQRLLNLGLLKKEEGTFRKTSERLTTPKDRASECIREHHRQVLTNAIQAIEEQTVAERVYNSCTMTVSTERLNEAKELILKFRADMAKLMEQDGGDETYQLAIQFFKLRFAGQHLFFYGTCSVRDDFS